jgi:phosphonate transport system substrate-binding protein
MAEIPIPARRIRREDVLMLTRRTFLASSAATCLLPSLALASEGLTLAFIPQESPDKLLGDIEAITSWLSAEMDLQVKGFVTFDHAAAVEALRNGDADISFMGALPFVLAEAEIGAVPLLSEVYRGAPSYSGRVFVRRDSGIKTLDDLRGRDIAFADPISESGYLYPLDLFVQAGLFASPDLADTFFGRKFFAGGYQQAMQAMAEGLVDAAGASQYADLLLTPEQQAEVTWIAESEPIPSHVVIARPGLADGVTDRFTEVMLSLNAPENRHLLAYLYGPDGYVAAETSRYDGVRETARRYGFLR